MIVEVDCEPRSKDMFFSQLFYNKGLYLSYVTNIKKN